MHAAASGLQTVMRGVEGWGPRPWRVIGYSSSGFMALETASPLENSGHAQRSGAGQVWACSEFGLQRCLPLR